MSVCVFVVLVHTIYRKITFCEYFRGWNDTCLVLQKHQAQYNKTSKKVWYSYPWRHEVSTVSVCVLLLQHLRWD